MTWLTVLRYRLRRAISKRLASLHNDIPPLELGALSLIREMERLGYLCHAQYFPVAMERGPNREQYAIVPDKAKFRFNPANAVRDALDIKGHVCGVAMLVRFCNPENPEERHQYIELCMQAAEEMRESAARWDEARRRHQEGGQ